MISPFRLCMGPGPAAGSGSKTSVVPGPLATTSMRRPRRAWAVGSTPPAPRSGASAPTSAMDVDVFDSRTYQATWLGGPARVGSMPGPPTESGCSDTFVPRRLVLRFSRPGSDPARGKSPGTSCTAPRDRNRSPSPASQPGSGGLWAGATPAAGHHPAPVDAPTAHRSPAPHWCEAPVVVGPAPPLPHHPPHRALRRTNSRGRWPGRHQAACGHSEGGDYQDLTLDSGVARGLLRSSPEVRYSPVDTPLGSFAPAEPRLFCSSSSGLTDRGGRGSARRASVSLPTCTTPRHQITRHDEPHPTGAWPRFEYGTAGSSSERPQAGPTLAARRLEDPVGVR